jgi:hypothetical protein
MDVLSVGLNSSVGDFFFFANIQLYQGQIIVKGTIYERTTHPRQKAARQR